MQWIYIKPHTYQCSACGKILTTSYPPEEWTSCPWCGEQLDSNSENEKE